ncbi:MULTISPECIES: FxsA family protein [Shewanella]|uniref:FxsA family protein n=1 Tax=Shewanella TaxID=22 RepID=UPI00048BAF4F|nr:MULTISPECIES: FxsA family protein [Shewanella]
MFFILLLIFVVVPVMELSVLIRVGEVLGSWTTVALVIFTAVVGVSLVRSQGISTLMQVQQKLARGEAPGQEIVEGMMLAVAGLLLLIPGFVTDFIGLVLLTPFTRVPVAKFFYKRMQLKVQANGGFQSGFGGGFGPGMGPQGRNPFDQGGQSPFDQGNTFDGDFERRPDPSDKRPESHQVKGNTFEGETVSPKDDDETNNQQSKR